MYKVSVLMPNNFGKKKFFYNFTLIHKQILIGNNICLARSSISIKHEIIIINK